MDSSEDEPRSEESSEGPETISPDPYARGLDCNGALAELPKSVSGIERLRELQRGGYPAPISQLLGVRVIDAADGVATIGMQP